MTTVLDIPLKDAIRACEACELRRQCHGPTPGRAPTGRARVMVVGAEPGFTEDASGRAWSGVPGRMMNALFEFIAVDPASEVYWTNLLKCRTHRTHTVTDEERAFCADVWLRREIDEVHPEVIVPVGAEAVRYFTGQSIDKVERVVHEWEG